MFPEPIESEGCGNAGKAAGVSRIAIATGTASCHDMNLEKRIIGHVLLWPGG
ncbi:hypothetical protein [Geobacter sulfurreducens]|uniref:hypothetical protein n=1 Tax=Geobacter sulfurreducens TaxID=35554 RepID=UPI002D1FB46E|nr:hypothetical protein [Geobacter sulfurreducens]